VHPRRRPLRSRAEGQEEDAAGQQHDDRAERGSRDVVGSITSGSSDAGRVATATWGRSSTTWRPPSASES
jgi:hypothetical protein